MTCIFVSGDFALGIKWSTFDLKMFHILAEKYSLPCTFKSQL